MNNDIVKRLRAALAKAAGQYGEPTPEQRNEWMALVEETDSATDGMTDLLDTLENDLATLHAPVSVGQEITDDAALIRVVNNALELVRSARQTKPL